MRKVLLAPITIALASLVGCEPEIPPAPPPSPAAPPPAAVDSAAPSAAAYAGHGAESVPPEVLAKFASPPLPRALEAKVQAMLDVRAPGAGRASEDGKRLFFSWTVTGVRQLWRIDGPQRFPFQMTGGEDATTLSDVSPDGARLVLARDKNGEENPGIYLQSPEGGALTEVLHKKGVQAFYEFTTADNRAIYYRANDVKPASFVIYRYDIATKQRAVVFDREGLWSVADHKGESKLLLEKALGSNQSEFYEYDVATKDLKPIIGQGEREEYVVRYAAQAGDYLVGTPKIGDFRRLYRLHAGKLEPVTPDAAFDVERFEIDEAKQRIYVGTNEGGYARLRVIDAKTFKDVPLPKLPAAENVSLAGVSHNGRFATLSLGTSSAPARAFVVDWSAKSATPWHKPSAPEIDTTRFAVPKLESYAARDGTKIPMFVRRPAAPCDGPCPVVVLFHGGPEGQARPGFSAVLQAFVDAGFVLVEPNVRGSDGYGKAWIHADDGPKRLKVITDIEDAAKHVRAAFAKDGKAPRVGIFGGSYGGYSTLVGMTMFAGAYDAGVEIVGMSNLVTFLMNTAPYRRALRISEYGDPEKDHDALVALSPMTHLDKLKAPLLLIQGASDPRVPVGEAMQIHEALDKKGVANQLIVFADEGHGAQKRGNQVAQYGHAIRFFQEHLQGKK